MATHLPLVLLGLLALIVVSAGIEDIRTREIANWKNAAIALMAPVFWWSIGLSPWPDVAGQLALAAAMLLLFGLAFARGWMGGGDVKMIVALSLWMPLGQFLSLLIVMSLGGGVLTAAMLLVRAWRSRRRDDAPPMEVPYGVAIAVAALISLREPILNQFS